MHPSFTPVPLKLQHLAVRPSGVDLWIGPQVPHAAVDAQHRGQRHHANQRVAAGAAKKDAESPAEGRGRQGGQRLADVSIWGICAHC